MNAKETQNTSVEFRMMQALQSFAGRIVNATDMQQVRKAGERLQSELKGVKIKP